MKAISLFSGAGGMDIGMEREGFDIVLANEKDRNACQTYRFNNPKTPLIEGDLNLHLSEFSYFKDIDLVFGGPPCQGFSVAGKMDPNDERSKLIFSFLDIVEITNPKSFIMENVKALGSLKKFEVIRNEFIKKASSLGYKVSMVQLNAKDFGVPQSRERIFFIGMQNKEIISSSDFEKFSSRAPSIRETILHLGRAGTPSNPHVTNAKITLAKKPILRKTAYSGMLFNGQGRPLNPNSWCTTLPASMGGNRTPIIDESHLYDDEDSWVESYHQRLINNENLTDIKVPKSLRRLTIDEAKLIQTFPEEYVFCGRQSNIFSQIGNAVPCKLAQIVGKVVKEKLSVSM